MYTVLFEKYAHITEILPPFAQNGTRGKKNVIERNTVGMYIFQNDGTKMTDCR